MIFLKRKARMTISDNSKLSQVDAGELQVIPEHLDVYSIACHSSSNLLLPQNCVISIIIATSDAKTVTWHDQQLSVWHLNDPNLSEAIALVVEVGYSKKRMVLMCDQMPEAFKLYSSQVVDLDETILDPSIHSMIKVDDLSYQIPNLEYIQHRLELNS
jgi:hypothetical protein